jgi:signal transduction histidine kinase
MLIAILSFCLLLALLLAAVLFMRYRQVRQLHANSVRLCHRVANEFSQRKENESVVERMFSLVVAHTHADMALLTYGDRGDGTVSVLQVHGIPDAALQAGTALGPGAIGYGFGALRIRHEAELYHEQLKEAVFDDTGIRLTPRQNMMCLPIVSNDTVHGMLQLISSPERPYTRSYLSDLGGLGIYMDAAIQNAERTNDIRRERNAAQALFNIGLKISRFGELGEILGNAVRETHRLLNSDFSWYLELAEPEENRAIVRTSSGNHGEKMGTGLEIPLQGRTAALVDMVRAQHKNLYLLIDDLEQNRGQGPEGYVPPPHADDVFCDDEMHQALASLQVRSAIIVPVGGNGVPRGLLCSFKHHVAYFGTFEVMLQRRIANQLLIAINTADYHKKVRQLALAEERQRISNELHDDMAQVINGLSLELHSFTRLVEKNTEQNILLNRLESIRPLLEQAQTAIREGISELRIPEGRRFSEVLVEVVTDFECRHDFTVHVEVPNERLILPGMVQRELIRITREALLNVAKHSGTQEAWVRLRKGAATGECTLEISDKGRHLTVGDITPGQGITTMHDRAQRINATVTLRPGEREGLTVAIEVPGHGD